MSMAMCALTCSGKLVLDPLTYFDPLSMAQGVPATIYKTPSAPKKIDP